MITGIFEEAFSGREAKEKLRKRWWNRTGMVAAYCLLDRDYDTYVTQSEFVEFVESIRPDMDRGKINELFKQLDANDSGAVDLTEFVHGMEELYLHNTFKQLRQSPQSESQRTMERFLTSWLYQKITLAFMIITYWTFALYNEHHANSIDKIVIGVIAIHIVDFTLKLVAYGPERFIWLTEYQNRSELDQFGNRCDAFFMFVTIAGWFLLIHYSIITETINENQWIRIFPAFCLLRVFMLWQTSKQFCYMLRSGLSTLTSLFVVMLTVFFVFGVIGVTLFKNGLHPNSFEGSEDGFEANFGENIEDENSGIYDYRVRHANFDTLGKAFILLTQAFLGEAFHELMEGVRVAWENNSHDEENWKGTWFIIVFYFLMSTLFNNLFFGLLLNIFGDLYANLQDGEILSAETVKKTTEPTIVDEVIGLSESELAEPLSYRLSMSDDPGFAPFEIEERSTSMI